MRRPDRLFLKMDNSRKKVSTEGGRDLSNNPFGALESSGLPSAPRSETAALGGAAAKPASKRSRGRIDVRREKSGRGGKTVTVISGFVGIAAEEKTSLAKTIQKRCGAGGAVKGGNIEIQGDKREEARLVLENAGFRVVFAGG